MQYDIRKFTGHPKTNNSQMKGMPDGQKLVPVYYIIF